MSTKNSDVISSRPSKLAKAFRGGAMKGAGYEKVGNTVNLETGKYTNTIGAQQLAAFWEDPDFDPAQVAFCYIRVLQIPTPRYSLPESIALGIVWKETNRPPPSRSECTVHPSGSVNHPVCVARGHGPAKIPRRHGRFCHLAARSPYLQIVTVVWLTCSTSIINKYLWLLPARISLMGVTSDDVALCSGIACHRRKLVKSQFKQRLLASG